jgi:KDO2-lipid IV(A) lauroyltransferase
LARLAAFLLYRLNTRSRDMIQSNVRHVLGPETGAEAVERTAQRIFHNLLKNYFDLFWLPAQSTEKVSRLITVEGYEYAHAALAGKKGAIAVTLHMGNQEIMTQLRALTDYKLTVVAEHIKPERVFQYLVSLRQHSGIQLIPSDGALRELLRALKRGEIIGLVFDRHVSDQGRVIPFFGSPARLPDGYAVLALKYGAPVLPVFVVRQAGEDGDTYAAHITPPIWTAADDVCCDEDVEKMMMTVGKVMEEYARRFLDQWVYFHYVWEDDKERARRARKNEASTPPEAALQPHA